MGHTLRRRTHPDRGQDYCVLVLPLGSQVVGQVTSDHVAGGPPPPPYEVSRLMQRKYIPIKKQRMRNGRAISARGMRTHCRE